MDAASGTSPRPHTARFCTHRALVAGCGALLAAIALTSAASAQAPAVRPSQATCATAPTDTTRHLTAEDSIRVVDGYGWSDLWSATYPATPTAAWREDLPGGALPCLALTAPGTGTGARARLVALGGTPRIRVRNTTPKTEEWSWGDSMRIRWQPAANRLEYLHWSPSPGVTWPTVRTALRGWPLIATQVVPAPFSAAIMTTGATGKGPVFMLKIEEGHLTDLTIQWSTDPGLSN